MSNIERQASAPLSFEQLQAEIALKGNAQTEQLLAGLTTSAGSALDVERVVFGSTNTGKPTATKLYQGVVFNWHRPGDKDQHAVVTNMKIVGVRGFILKAKDGYAYFGKNSDSDTGESGGSRICGTTECTVGDYTFKGNTPSPYPLSKWINNGEMKLHQPSKHLKGLNLQGSRGQSCHECVLNGNNFSYKKNPDGSLYIDPSRNTPSVESQCKPVCGLLFAVTHVAKQNIKKPEGIEWLHITEIKDEDLEPYTDRPLILNIDLTQGIMNYANKGDSTLTLRPDNGPKKVIQIATASNGGERYVPDDVKLFYHYWLELTSQGLISPAPKGGSYPEHPRLPFIVQAQTELFLASPTAGLPYAKSLPSFRTSALLSDRQVFEDWLSVLNLYVNTYDDYVSQKELVKDPSFELVGSRPTISPSINPSSSQPQTVNAEVEFDATSSQPNVYSYRGEDAVA